VRLVTLGVGAMNSPRFAPAGLLVAHRGVRVMIDGGPGAEPPGRIDAWLVTDERAELIGRIRRLAADRGLRPVAAPFRCRGLRIERRSVVHTRHPTWGYLIRSGGRAVAWAPEFYRFPPWARGADLMFADGSSWDRPIRFVAGAGGHADVLTTARAARRCGVGRLVFAHIGRPTLRALARGARPPFGELASDGQIFVVGRGREVRRPVGRRH
jgi:hypothetical protein